MRRLLLLCFALIAVLDAVGCPKDQDNFIYVPPDITTAPSDGGKSVDQGQSSDLAIGDGATD